MNSSEMDVSDTLRSQSAEVYFDVDSVAAAPLDGSIKRVWHFSNYALDYPDEW